jgi:hypothetical protein
MAGSSSSEVAAALSATTAPPIPIDCRNRSAEDDSAPGCLERCCDRHCGRESAAELFAKPRDEDQAVIDREAKPEADDDVQRERGQRQRGVDQAQREHRSEHARDPDPERQQRRDTKENQECKKGEQREGEQLGEAEVLGGLQVGLNEGDVSAPQLHVVSAGEVRAQSSNDGIWRRVGVQRRGQQRRASVFRDQRQVVRVRVA